VTVPAYNETLRLSLADTPPRAFASDDEITQPIIMPAPLPQPLARWTPPTLLDRVRRTLAEWLWPRSRAERQLIDAAIVHHAAELHWQRHPLDRVALAHWGVAQDEQAAAVERLLAVRNG
jgi:hypothetical protein